MMKELEGVVKSHMQYTCEWEKNTKADKLTNLIEKKKGIVFPWEKLNWRIQLFDIIF